MVGMIINHRPQSRVVVHRPLYHQVFASCLKSASKRLLLKSLCSYFIPFLDKQCFNDLLHLGMETFVRTAFPSSDH